jgi:adenylate kinase family enzyme
MKISIFGPTASGKSYLAKKLGEHFNIPVIHFDKYYLNPDGTKLDKNVLCDKVLSMLKTDWIIDGNRTQDNELTKVRFTQSDIIIILDFDEKDCIAALNSRQGKPRDDISPYLVEQPEHYDELVNVIKEWKPKRLPKIMSFVQKYNAAEKLVILKTREQVNRWLLGVKG